LLIDEVVIELDCGGVQLRVGIKNFSVLLARRRACPAI